MLMVRLITNVLFCQQSLGISLSNSMTAQTFFLGSHNPCCHVLYHGMLSCIVADVTQFQNPKVTNMELRTFFRGEIIIWILDAFLIFN